MHTGLRAMSNFISLLHAFVLTACVNAMLLVVSTQAETFTTLRGAIDNVAATYRIQVGLEYAAHDKGPATDYLGRFRKERRCRL
jgi:hypothetical protein